MEVVEEELEAEVVLWRVPVGDLGMVETETEVVRRGLLEDVVVAVKGEAKIAAGASAQMNKCRIADSVCWSRCRHRLNEALLTTKTRATLASSRGDYST